MGCGAGEAESRPSARPPSSLARGRSPSSAAPRRRGSAGAHAGHRRSSLGFQSSQRGRGALQKVATRVPRVFQGEQGRSHGLGDAGPRLSCEGRETNPAAGRAPASRR